MPMAIGNESRGTVLGIKVDEILAEVAVSKAGLGPFGQFIQSSTFSTISIPWV
jgi:hypothetical protein